MWDRFVYRAHRLDRQQGRLHFQAAEISLPAFYIRRDHKKFFPDFTVSGFRQSST